MKGAIVLRFEPDGTGRTLHTEAINLAELGRLEMRRASNVEWNGKAQQWEAREANGGAIIHASTSREECLQAEREHFNTQLLTQ